MQLTNKHKAALITFFISASVVMALFAFQLKNKTLIAETYYELEPEEPVTEEDVKALEEKLKEVKGEKAETNEAFNETQQKRFAQAYKIIEPPKDYIPQNPEGQEENSAVKDVVIDDSKKLNQEERDRFNKANQILKQQQEEGVNTKSTMHYSLVDREHLYLPTPVYLCENGGKIVVNITVNANGDVIQAGINQSYASADDCLKEYALDYAKKARFTPDASKPEQLGAITFYFIGKR
ncbi:MAG TPA: energy transducer TonB [Flavobacteriaceae bacterium]|nr:energy transducer TonB [Flavobacteriaceae bacterium]